MLGHIIFSSVNKGTSFLSATGATYVLMNNQTLLRTSYPYLSNYWPEGSFGSTSGFMVIPNLQDLVLRGADIGRGADENVLNRTSISGVLPSGATVGSYQIAAMPSHIHVSGTFASGTGTQIRSPNTGPNVGQTIQPLQYNVTATSLNTLFFHPSQASGIIQSGTLSTSFTVGGVTAYPYICVAV